MKFALLGTGFRNKGAELMMHAVIQQVTNWDPENIVAADLQTGDFKQRSDAGLHHLLWINFHRYEHFEPFLSGFSYIIPKSLAGKFRVLPMSEVDVFLDASGFAYGDQWGTAYTAHLAKNIVKWKDQGKKVILLPQAFGPFEIPENKKAIQVILEYADMVFARDPISYQHLIDTLGKKEHVKIAPDFTHLLLGVPPGADFRGQPYACITPNSRMLDKTTQQESEVYESSLLTIARHLEEKELKIVLLQHEINDNALISRLQKKLNDSAIIISEPDPLKLKGYIANASVAVGSRYHGLVSALSQNIPTLGTGWSHKYQMLFDEYNCSDFLVSVTDPVSQILEKLDQLLEASSRRTIINNINRAVTRNKELSVAMWETIHNSLLI